LLTATPSTICFVLLLAMVGLASEVAAAETADATTEIHVVTMGPGEGLYTRGGHLALMVATLVDGQPVATKIYNFGVTDWDNPWMVPEFFAGRLTFFLDSPGSLDDVARDYGVGQVRTVYRQKLRLSDAQTAAMVTRLEHEVEPENRNYRYHHVEAICTTRARDLIDEVVGGAVRQQLSSLPSDATVQQDVQLAFSGHVLPSIAADLFFGRRHYRPVDLYYGLYEPARMRAALQRVIVPDPLDPTRRVPLADPPVKIGERIGTPLNERPSHASVWMAIVFAVFLLALGADAYRQLPEQTRVAGAWLACWALPSGLLGLLIAALMAWSNVPELHQNELVLSFPPTDLLLLGLAVRWLRGGGASLRFAKWYALTRAAVSVLCLVACAAGLFIQRPVMLPLLGLSFGVGLLVMLRRAAAPGTEPLAQPPCVSEA
jgi:hypothetical protein